MLPGMPKERPVLEFQLDEFFDHQNAVDGGVYDRVDMGFGQQEEGGDYRYQNQHNQPLRLHDPSPPMQPQQGSFHYPNPQYHQLQLPQHQNLLENHSPFDVVPQFDFGGQDFHNEYPIWQQPAAQEEPPLYFQRSFSPSPSLFQSSDLENEEMPYNQMLHRCLKQQPDCKLELQEIYRWFMKNYPSRYSAKERGWQNSIRHNLSMNEAFEKATQCDGEGSKIHFWQLSLATRTKGIVEPTTRYRNVNERRGKKRRAGSPSYDMQRPFKRRPNAKGQLNIKPRRNAPRGRRRDQNLNASPEPDVANGLPTPPPTGGETTDEEATDYANTSRGASPAQPALRNNMVAEMLEEYNGGLAQMFHRIGEPQLKLDALETHPAAGEMLHAWTHGHMQTFRVQADPNMFRQPEPMAMAAISQSQSNAHNHHILQPWLYNGMPVQHDQDLNGGIYDDPFHGQHNHFQNVGNIDVTLGIQPRAALENLNLPVIQDADNPFVGMIDPYLLAFDAPAFDVNGPDFGLEHFGLGLGEEPSTY